MATASSRGQRRRTFTETARRAQLIEVTVEQVAEKGYAGASLGAIAEAAGITKAAVLYHVPSKDALVDAAYEHVLSALTEEVGAAVEAAPVGEGPTAYVRSMIGCLRERPQHTRMIVEALSRDGAGHLPQERWGPLAQLLDAAAAQRGADVPDSRSLAIIVGGAIDAIVSERMHDPTYDTAEAADQLVALIDAALTP